MKYYVIIRCARVASLPVVYMLYIDYMLSGCYINFMSQWLELEMVAGTCKSRSWV